MKTFMLGFALIALVGTRVTAQDTAYSEDMITSEDTEIVYLSQDQTGTSSPKTIEKSSRIYSKRVGKIIWIEGTIGQSWFHPTRFLGLLDSIPETIGTIIPDIRLQGPEAGAALRFRKGAAAVGVSFKVAFYDDFDLITTGFDSQFMIRAVPYVTPYLNFALNYNQTQNEQAFPGLEALIGGDFKGNGLGASLGIGLRVPVIKWISMAGEFNYTVVAMALRGQELITGNRFVAGTLGDKFAANFILTFHLY